MLKVMFSPFDKSGHSSGISSVCLVQNLYAEQECVPFLVFVLQQRDKMTIKNKARV